MSSKKRVLIIEDDRIIRDKFKKIIEKMSIEVEIAGTKLEALEKIKCRTYHVALIDIMLSDNPFDRGGIECLSKLNDLNEGTEAVVISATNDIRVPVEAWKKGALEYLIKKDIRTSKDITEIIGKAINKCKLKLFGKHDYLTDYLACEENTTIFEAKLMEVFGSNINDLYNICNRIFKEILPILKEKGKKQILNIDTNNKQLTGLMWSKAVGQPIWIYIGDKSAPEIEPSSLVSPAEKIIVVQDNIKNFIANIWKIKLPRDLFEENIYLE